jgi:hypothetical protein
MTRNRNRNRNRFTSKSSNEGAAIPVKEKIVKRRKKDTRVARAALKNVVNAKNIQELVVKNKNAIRNLPEEIVFRILEYTGTIHSNDGYKVFKLGFNENEPIASERRKRLVIYRLMTCSSQDYINCIKYLNNKKEIFTNTKESRHGTMIRYNLKVSLEWFEKAADKHHGWTIEWEVKWGRGSHENSLISCIRREPAYIFTEEILNNL